MAHQALKPYSFLMYFLAIIAFFFLGLIYAGIIDAGKGQMLAGGAIVLGYGVIGALIGLTLFLIIAFKVKRPTIIKLNMLLALVIVASIVYFRAKYKERQQEKQENGIQKIDKPTSPTLGTETNQTIAMSFSFEEDQVEPIMGLGMFQPNISVDNTFYFYGNLTLGKPVEAHMPVDSITFKKREYGGFDIATAPPWLAPNHLKLDYDILYFKVKSVSRDFIEVVVNTMNNRTAFVDKNAGKLHFWPEFFLQVNSVEFIGNNEQYVYERPFKKSSQVTTEFSVMKPIKVMHNWMYVELLNDGFKIIGKGWIQWKDDEELLIRYALLS